MKMEGGAEGQYYGGPGSICNCEGTLDNPAKMGRGHRGA